MDPIEATRQVSGMISERGLYTVCGGAIIALALLQWIQGALREKRWTDYFMKGRGKNGSAELGLLQLHEKLDSQGTKLDQVIQRQEHFELRLRPLEMVVWSKHQGECSTPEALVAAEGAAGE